MLFSFVLSEKNFFPHLVLLLLVLSSFSWKVPKSFGSFWPGFKRVVLWFSSSQVLWFFKTFLSSFSFSFSHFSPQISLNQTPQQPPCPPFVQRTPRMRPRLSSSGQSRPTTMPRSTASCWPPSLPPSSSSPRMSFFSSLLSFSFFSLLLSSRSC